MACNNMALFNVKAKETVAYSKSLRTVSIYYPYASKRKWDIKKSDRSICCSYPGNGGCWHITVDELESLPKKIDEC
jgi:uncharacterized protein (DUF427 family)